MAIEKFNPYRTLKHIRRDLDDWLTESPLKKMSSSLGDSDWVPSFEVIEKNDEYVVKGELPGMSKDDVKIDVNGDTLTIRGEKQRREETSDDQNYYRQEIEYGTFSRSFTVPGGIEGDKVNASFKNGLLKLKIPKTEKSKVKRVEIS